MYKRQQKDSYQWFLDEGLNEVFEDISPIADYSGKLSLEFVGFTLCEDEKKYTIEQCKERDATYAAPLKVKVRLHNKENGEITTHEILDVYKRQVNPTAIVGPGIVATAVSTVVAILFCKIMNSNKWKRGV